MFESRATTLLPTGTTAKVLCARTSKAITEIKSRIEKLATPYEEIDNSVTGAVSELMSAFEKFEQHIKDTQRYLEEVL